MEKSNSGMHGHGMPIESTKVEPWTPKMPNGSELKSNKSTSTTIHDSKHFPFQIVEVTTTINDENNPSETKEFYIGMAGEFVSKKTFSELAQAEKYIASRPWELITNLVCVTFKNAFEYEKSKPNN